MSVRNNIPQIIQIAEMALIADTIAWRQGRIGWDQLLTSMDRLLEAMGLERASSSLGGLASKTEP